MDFDSRFEADYIRQFASIVKRPTTPRVFGDGIGRIRAALSMISDPQVRSEALRRINQIGNYAGIYIDDPKGSRQGIVKEIEELADFVSKYNRQS